MKYLFRYPLQRRILIFVSCLVFLPYLALSYSISAYYENYNREKKSQQYTSMLHIAELMVNHHLAQVENTVSFLTTSQSIKKAVQGKNKNEMALSLLFDVPEDLDIITASLREYHAEIYLITMDDNTFERYNQFYHVTRFKDDKEFVGFMENGRSSAWLSPRVKLGTMPLYSNSGYTVIPFCRKVSNLSTTLGAVMCSVRMEDIFFSPLQELSQYGVVKVMKDGVCIYKMADGQVLTTDEEPESSADPVRFLAQSMQYPYQLSLEVPSGELDSAGYFWSFLLLFCLVYVAIMVIIAYSFNTLLKKLNFVSELLLVIDPNQDNQRIPNLGENEINTLGNSINKLLSKIETQRHELIKSERDRRLAARSALQLQMNPHLLFNSLHWLELNLFGENSEVQRGVALLGEMYRYNLTSGNFVEIGEEIKSAETYVEMMRLLKTSGILLDISCPDELYTGSILRFTLQPIVENAIKHGSQKDTPIHMHIRFHTSGAVLSIAVSNDGLLIPPEKLQQLNASLSHPSQKEASSHIGLPNLAQRLYLTYGEDAKLQIGTENGITTVTVSIPCGGYEHENEDSGGR